MRTQLRGMVEKYRYKAQKCIALGVMTTDSSKPFECAFWLEGAWEHDAEMENLIHEEPPFVRVPGTKLPGRNKPCMCGSGKKFKKCRLARFDVGRRKRPDASNRDAH